MSILDRLIGLKSGDENLQIDKLKYNFDSLVLEANLFHG